jgi:hypothetical protein
MRESYREGVANHSGPEPCEGGRKAALEASDRGIRRQDIELRNQPIPGADAVIASGRQHENGRPGEFALDPAESETPGMRRNSTRENRETPWPPAASSTAGRKENARSGKSFRHGRGESYSGIVCAEQHVVQEG